MIWHVDPGVPPDRAPSRTRSFHPTSTTDRRSEIRDALDDRFLGCQQQRRHDLLQQCQQYDAIQRPLCQRQELGYFEYNPMEATSKANNMTALNAVFTNKGHVSAPTAGTVKPQMAIESSFGVQTALQQFVYDHRNDKYTGMAAYEAAPDSRDIIWRMSGPTTSPPSTPLVASPSPAATSWAPSQAIARPWICNGITGEP